MSSYAPAEHLEHTILQLVNDISSFFERGECTLGLFIAFDTADCETLISKIEHYGIKAKNFKRLKSYLSERK